MRSNHLARRWVVGTTIVSSVALIIWGWYLVRDPSVLPATARVLVFGLLGTPYGILLVARMRATIWPHPAQPGHWIQTLGLIYWLVTLPFLWYIGFLLYIWNGVPGV
jgi:hypothetical protein